MWDAGDENLGQSLFRVLVGHKGRARPAPATLFGTACPWARWPVLPRTTLLKATAWSNCGLDTKLSPKERAGGQSGLGSRWTQGPGDGGRHRNLE